jgi:hypothetical protein
VQLAELAVRRHLLEEADLRLREVAALDVDLGHNSNTYELLRAIVDLRLGRLEPAQLDRLRRMHGLFSDEQLSAWFEQLELTRSERQQLGLD